MAIKRMFSREVIELLGFDVLSDKAKMGYVYLGLNADDDGFVTNPKKLGVSKLTVEVLEKAGFIYRFSNGTVLIRHWFVHNTIRKDMYKPTLYAEQKALVILDESKVYQMKSVTQPQQSRTQSATQNREEQIKEKQIKEDQNKQDQIKENQIRSEEISLEQENRNETVATATDACGASLGNKEREYYFDVFWEKYPNKCNYSKAKDAFMRLDIPVEEIMEGLEHHLKCNYWVNNNGQFVPFPDKWLNSCGWKNRPPLYIEKPPVGATGGLGKEELAAIQRVLAEETDPHSMASAAS